MAATGTGAGEGGTGAGTGAGEGGTGAGEGGTGAGGDFRVDMTTPTIIPMMTNTTITITATGGPLVGGGLIILF